MALTVTTVRPNSTAQTGSGTVTGAGTAHAALADSSDASYVQLAVRCRLDSEVIRIGFPTPTIPAGAKVYSVGLRRRVLSVVAGNARPVCHHWFRSQTGTIAVAGQVLDVHKLFFNSDCPTSLTTATWVDEDLGEFRTGPGGKPWLTTGPDANLSGLSYDMGRGDDFSPNLRVSAVYLDIRYQVLSSVTVTGPISPNPATRPTVTWTYASSDSQPQQAYRVVIYTAAQVAVAGFAAFVTAPVQASGAPAGIPGSSWWLLGEDLGWTLPRDLTDGTYHAFVQAVSRWDGVGDFPTAVATRSWTRTAAPSNPPPVAALSSAVFDQTNNRVGLTFAPSSSSPTTTAFTVQASRDNGVSWRDIPSLTHLPASGMTPVTAYDATAAPLGVLSRYRVVGLNGTPLVASVAPSNELAVTPQDRRHWLKSPDNPLLNTPIQVAAPKANEGLKITRRRTQGGFTPIGSKGSVAYPLFVQGATHGEEHDLDLLFLRGEESWEWWPAFNQLDRTGGTLLLQNPDGTQLWVVMGAGMSGQDPTVQYDAVPGNPGKVAYRRAKVTFTQVAEPNYY